MPVLAWFVDNPWHALSGMRDPSWKNFFLAVTDHTFIDPLELAIRKLHELAEEGQAAGSGEPVPARNPKLGPAAANHGEGAAGVAQPAGSPRVFHMPLAGCPRSMEESRAYAERRGKGRDDDFAPPPGEVVFAGRSVFPEYASYFAGQNIPEELLVEAEKLCAKGVRADFDWWAKRMGLPGERGFWPGKASRVPGLGAAASNRIWRRQRLVAAMSLGLTLYGDEGWASLLCHAGSSLPELVYGERPDESEGGNATRDRKFAQCRYNLDLRPQFDYYAHVYEVYNGAPFTLNLNSLIMSAGLTQRIYDTWLADGFCITDNSAGLSIFPDELTHAVTFNEPEELPGLVRYFSESPGNKEELRRAWKNEILEKHTYRTRLETLLAQLRQAGAAR